MALSYVTNWGTAYPTKADLMVGATVTAGEAVRRDTNLYGEIIPAAVDGAADAMGVTTHAATYDATPLTSEFSGPGSRVNNGAMGAVAETIINPDAIFSGNICGSATAGTALSSSTRNYLTIAGASATVLADVLIGTLVFDGGLACAITGNNKGQIRTLTSHTDNVSRTVTVAFTNSFAAGDRVLVVPFSRLIQKGYLTTDFASLDGYTADNTSGFNARFVEVIFDVDNISAKGHFIFSDHAFNPESA